MNRSTICKKVKSTSTLVAMFAVMTFCMHPAIAQESKPIRALLVIGGCCHDYATQKDLLTKGISARANVSWTIAYDPDKGTKHLNPIYENPDWAKGFDVVVHDECCSDVTDPRLIERVLKPHRDGLPAVILHCGMHSYRSKGYPDEVTPWFEFTGLKTTGHGAQLPISISIADTDHPIMKGQTKWTTIKEELYNNFSGKLLDTGHILARGMQTSKTPDGRENVDDCIVAWTNTYNTKTRVFATTLGHNNDTVADPRYLDLVTRGLLWSVDKLDEEHLKPAQNVLLSESAAGK
ncbi:MAG: ThuA domain-containing protein [Pirellulaceae bacterium]